MDTQMHLEFSGLPALVFAAIGLVTIVSMAIIILRYQKAEKSWQKLGFMEKGVGFILTRLMLLVATMALVTVGLMEPAITIRESVRERQDVEACYLIDNAGSMAASADAESETRLELGTSIAIMLTNSSAMAGVPTCIATFTDAPSIHLPATAHRPTIRSVLRDVIRIGDPPPGQSCRSGEVCTSLVALKPVAKNNFFSKDSDEATRVIIVFTDGESNRFQAQETARYLEEQNIKVIFVDLWKFEDKIFDTENCVESPYGCIDPNYETSTIGRQIFLTFAEQVGPVFSQSELEELVQEVQALVGEGEGSVDGRVIEETSKRQPLAWLFFLAAGFLALVANGSHVTNVVASRIHNKRK